jgi:ABC-type glycerol-3-phosphate transport system permease component
MADAPQRVPLAGRQIFGGELARLLVPTAVALAFFFPVYFMISSAFKAEGEILATPMHWLPHDFQGLGQLYRAAEIAPIARYFFNSSLVSAINVVVTLFFGAMAGYGFAKFDFPARKFLFYFVISTMMIPSQILLVPLFIEIRSFGWANSYLGLIVPGIMNAFGVFMMRQYCFGIPDEIIEAGRVDGANEWQIFLRLVLPLLSPALASLAIIIFIWSWGNFLWPLVAVNDDNLTVLAVGLTNYTQPYQRTPMWGAAMAASTVATLPMMCVFIFFQRYFIRGITAAAVKE